MEHTLPQRQNALRKYVDETFLSGIQQHSDSWHNARIGTIGGSAMSVIKRTNPYQTRRQLLEDKTIGSKTRKSSLAMNTGTLFEDTLRTFVELDLGTTVVADNDFVYGPPGTNTSYSPDGLGVVDATRLAKYGIAYDELCAQITPADPCAAVTPHQHIVLFEFKCLYTRIPTKSPPVYYIPQVKTGLDIIPIADYGLLIEAVFRRCAWQDMGLNAKFDTTLTPKKYGRGVLAMGIHGFYHDADAFAQRLACSDADHARELKTVLAQFNRQYALEYNVDATNDHAVSSVELFTLLLECYTKSILHVWRGEVIVCDNDAECRRRLNASLADYQRHNEACNVVNYGILPYKLFGVKVHVIHRTRGYIAQSQDEIDAVVDIVRKYHALPSEEERRRFYEQNIYEPTEYTVIE